MTRFPFTRPKALTASATTHLPILIVVLAFALAFPRFAIAQSSRSVVADEHTGRSFEEGVEAFDEGRYEEAWVSFRKAYALNPTTFISYNLALSAFKTGRYVESARLLEQATPCATACPAELQKDIHKLLAQASEHTGQLEIRVPVAGARVDVDGETLPPWAVSKRWHVVPGTHQITIYVGDEAKVQNVTVRAGETVAAHLDQQVDAKAVESTTSTASSPSATVQGEPTDDTQHISFETGKAVVVIVATSLTIASLSSAVALGINASNLREDARKRKALEGGQLDRCTVASPQCQKLEQTADTARWRQSLSNRLFLTSGILAAATTAAWLFWPTGKATTGSYSDHAPTASGTWTKQVQLQTEVGLSGASITVVGSF